MKQGFRLHGHVLEAFWAQTVALCRIKCYLEKRCSTYNYESATQRCELNKAVISSQWKDLRRNQGFVYVDMKKTTTTPVDQVLCKQSVAVGIQNNSIISKYYFTIDKDSYYGDQARLNGPGGWYSNNRNKYHWLKINLGKIAMITRIATQGHHKYHQWVTSYSLATSTNGSTPYTSYNNGQVFPANKDANTIVYNDLKPAIKARYVKVYPKTWRKAVGLRMEIYECKEYEGKGRLVIMTITHFITRLIGETKS
ncbi:retinoschisin-like [Exaiptasia diaphana]|uniref:Uncharacterized protein n=1 Tax=Exaiptasia diaphana TaxID=2652724 RepID=A0A913YMV5_EXADI|nr:retinoschisin-like [Exaiptasia diaphana]